MASTEMFLGRKSAFLYADEDVTYGTKNTATTWSWPGYVQKWSPTDNVDLFELNEMDGTDTRNVSEHYPMLYKYGGTLEHFLQHMRFPARGFGTDTVTGAGPTYTHTLAQSTSTLQPFSMQIGHVAGTNFGKEYTGCTIGKTDINFPKGGFVTCVHNIVAQNAVAISAYKSYQASVDSLKKYTASAIRPYKSSDATFKLNNIDIGPFVTQARLSWDNDLSIEPAMDTNTGDLITEPVPQVQKVDAGLTVRMSAGTYWNMFKAGVDVPNCSFKLTNGTSSITFTLGGVKLPSANDDVDITQGIVVQDVPIKATSVTIVEVNGITTDYDTAEA